MEAMRCLQRRLSNVACRQMLHDQDNKQAPGLSLEPCERWPAYWRMICAGRSRRSHQCEKRL